MPNRIVRKSSSNWERDQKQVIQEEKGFQNIPYPRSTEIFLSPRSALSLSLALWRVPPLASFPIQLRTNSFFLVRWFRRGKKNEEIFLRLLYNKKLHSSQESGQLGPAVGRVATSGGALRGPPSLNSWWRRSARDTIRSPLPTGASTKAIALRTAACRCGSPSAEAEKQLPPFVTATCPWAQRNGDSVPVTLRAGRDMRQKGRRGQPIRPKLINFEARVRWEI